MQQHPEAAPWNISVDSFLVIVLSTLMSTPANGKYVDFYRIEPREPENLDISLCHEFSGSHSPFRVLKGREADSPFSRR